MSVTITGPRVVVSIAGLGVKVAVAPSSGKVAVAGQQGPAGPSNAFAQALFNRIYLGMF